MPMYLLNFLKIFLLDSLENKNEEVVSQEPVLF